jgi:hypothetical protein
MQLDYHRTWLQQQSPAPNVKMVRKSVAINQRTNICILGRDQRRKKGVTRSTLSEAGWSGELGVYFFFCKHGSFAARL